MPPNDDTRKPAERLLDAELIELPEPPLLESAEGGDSADNRRRFKRIGVDKSVRVTELDPFGNPSTTWDCRVVDLSRGGVGLRSRRMVHGGRTIIIEFPNVSGKGKVLCGLVRQSRYAEGEGYVIGVEFKGMPQSHAVRSWLALRGLAA